jgi:uncharacterized protein (TIGR02300 family)
MSKDLGTKHTCFKCQTKFYDLKKPAPICPKCGADQRDVPPPKVTERKKAAAPTLEALEDEDEVLKESDSDEEVEEPEEDEEP